MVDLVKWVTDEDYRNANLDPTGFTHGFTDPLVSGANVAADIAAQIGELSQALIGLFIPRKARAVNVDGREIVPLSVAMEVLSGLRYWVSIPAAQIIVLLAALGVAAAYSSTGNTLTKAYIEQRK